MTVDDKKLIKTVSALNDSLAGQELFSDENDFHAYFEFKTDGNVQIVEFLGCKIWDSENDEREIVKKDYEPVAPFIIKQAKRLLNCLQKIEFEPRQ